MNSTRIIILAILATGFAAYWFSCTKRTEAPALISSDANQAPSATSNSPVIPNRTELELSPANRSSDPTIALESVRSCLRGNDDKIACLLAQSSIPYDIALYSELIAILASESRESAALLAAAFLLKADPLEAVANYMELDRLARSRSTQVDDLVMEGGILTAQRQLSQEWLHEATATITEDLVFGSAKTEIGVIFAGCLAKLGHRECLEALRRGLADHIGTNDQDSRAVAALAVTATDGLRAHLELDEIVKQASPLEPSAAAEMAGILALRSRFWPDGDPSPAIQLVDKVLANPEWGPKLTAQIRADYGSDPPRGISVEQWKTIELSMQFWE